MSENFAIIGGDLRIVKLARLLAKDGKTVYTYGLDKADELKNNVNIVFCNTINDALSKEVKAVIGPIPFSSNNININAPFGSKEITIKELIQKLKNKILIAGNISKDIYDINNELPNKIIDIMKQEELAILNAIATAEGAIEIAIANTNKNIQNSNILILGFGRIGKVLAKKLQALSANVSCSARKNEDLAWIKAYGYNVENTNLLGENLSEFDIIINTIPHLILDEEKIKYLKEECVLIDLASKPGGIDKKTSKDRNLKLISALALPRKSSTSYNSRIY